VPWSHLKRSKFLFPNEKRPQTARHALAAKGAVGTSFARLTSSVLFSKGRCVMTLAAEKEMEHIGESSGCADHDHDLIHDLSKRLDALWRYDQYVANAEGKAELQDMWRDMKRQEMANIDRVKQMIAKEIRENCF
jgi:hypothetical protein